MATVREQIMQAVLAALDGVGKPAGLNVFRYRTRPLTEEEYPALVVYNGTEQVDRVGNHRGSLVRRELGLRIEGRTIGDTPDVDLDPILAWVTQALIAAPSLPGNLAITTEEDSTEWEHEEAEVGYSVARMLYRVTYSTLPHNQEVKS